MRLQFIVFDRHDGQESANEWIGIRINLFIYHITVSLSPKDTAKHINTAKLVASYAYSMTSTVPL